MAPRNGGEEPDPSGDAEAAYDSAVRLLARREHARSELDRKLRERGFGADAARTALDRLEEHRYLSDERFAEQFVRERSGRGQGPLRLTAELRRRGIDDGVIDGALAHAGVDWDTLAREARERRFGALPEAGDRREWARQARFLEQRGFSAEQVRAALNDEEF